MGCNEKIEALESELFDRSPFDLAVCRGARFFGDAIARARRLTRLREGVTNHGLSYLRRALDAGRAPS
jgi:hypothetical protein